MSVGFVTPWVPEKDQKRKGGPYPLSNTCKGSGINSKAQRRLAGRIAGWDRAVKAKAVGSYRKPGSNKK